MIYSPYYRHSDGVVPDLNFAPSIAKENLPTDSVLQKELQKGRIKYFLENITNTDIVGGIYHGSTDSPVTNKSSRSE